MDQYEYMRRLQKKKYAITHHGEGGRTNSNKQATIGDSLGVIDVTIPTHKTKKLKKGKEK